MTTKEKMEIYTLVLDEINSVLEVVEESDNPNRDLNGIAVIEAIFEHMEKALKEECMYIHLEKEKFERIINE